MKKCKYIPAGSYHLNPTIEPSIGGLNVNEFLDLYNQTVNYELPYGNAYAPSSYDAVWALALALNTTLSRMHNLGTDNYDY